MTTFLKILEYIKVDDNLHVKLQYNGMPLPLSHCHATTGLFKVIMQQWKRKLFWEFPSVYRKYRHQRQQFLRNELNQRNFYKQQGRPPYLSSMIQFSLHLRYTSLQEYRLLLEKPPMLPFSLLNNIQQGRVDALKALKTLYEKAPFLMTVF